MDRELNERLLKVERLVSQIVEAAKISGLIPRTSAEEAVKLSKDATDEIFRDRAISESERLRKILYPTRQSQQKETP